MILTLSRKDNSLPDIFGTALVFMYEARGDGDCEIMTDNYAKLVIEFESWLKRKENFLGLQPDFFTKIDHRGKGHDCITFTHYQEGISFVPIGTPNKLNYNTMIIKD